MAVKITGKQRAARKRNIKIAQKASKRSKPGSARRKAGKAFAAAYKAARRKGASKKKARFKGHQVAYIKTQRGSQKFIRTAGGAMSIRKKMSTSLSGKPTAKKSAKENYRGIVSNYTRGNWAKIGRQSVNWFK